MTENVKRRWEPYNQVINNQKMYIAGRVKDSSNILHSGNIEYTGNYSTDIDAVTKLCNELNTNEGEVD